MRESGSTCSHYNRLSSLYRLPYNFDLLLNRDRTEHHPESLFRISYKTLFFPPIDQPITLSVFSDRNQVLILFYYLYK